MAKAETCEAVSPDEPHVVVILPAGLTRLFPGAAHRVNIRAATLADVMRRLDERWPGMRDRLCDTTPAIRRHINVFVNGERATLNTPLRPGCEVFIVTSISGG